MSPRKPWQPRVDPDTELNPFHNGAADADNPLDNPQIEDPEEDSAPLQGSKDLSDDDSLEDVIADDSEERP